MKLTQEDVSEILQLLDAGPFGELRLQTLRFKLLLKRGGDGEWTQETEVVSPANLMHTAPAAAPAAATPRPDAAHAEPEHLRPVRAPLLGTFYRAPKPGAAAFVEVGDRVEKNTVVGIVETMKLMNSVYAGVAGKVVEILVKDSEFVEQDGVVMRIEEAAA